MWWQRSKPKRGRTAGDERIPALASREASTIWCSIRKNDTATGRCFVAVWENFTGDISMLCIETDIKPYEQEAWNGFETNVKLPKKNAKVTQILKCGNNRQPRRVDIRVVSHLVGARGCDSTHHHPMALESFQGARLGLSARSSQQSNARRRKRVQQVCAGWKYRLASRHMITRKNVFANDLIVHLLRSKTKGACV